MNMKMKMRMKMRVERVEVSLPCIHLSYPLSPTQSSLLLTIMRLLVPIVASF